MIGFRHLIIHHERGSPWALLQLEYISPRASLRRVEIPGMDAIIVTAKPSFEWDGE